MTAEPLGAGTRIGRVDLRVRDLDAALGFYRDVLGFAVDRDDGTATLSAGGGPVLRLTAGATQPAPTRATGLFHTAILYPTRTDLADALGRLAAARVRLAGASDHGVSEALYLDDPDGNGVELYADRPREAWGRRPDGGIDIYTAPLDLHDLLGAADRPPEPGAPIPDGVTVGHVHLKVADVERAVGFYRDQVGLQLMATYPQAAFLSGGGYHHHLGANTWQSLGAPPPPPGSAGLLRYEIRVPAGVPARNLRDPDGIEVALVPDA
jgi:catechol 2,3-dioxygenase